MIDGFLERSKGFVVLALLHQHAPQLFMAFGLIRVNFYRLFEVS